ncbi:uncharacterized protein AMSG_02670 [Thecamonas trahens ATCC 50062]|uniref:V-SNARE coiled-coil homology domain-containing protein n=1 Tax=Thecamonas trahens ATCC 50062 TaxID=461836 RepID=A0A0L0D1I1_THETB|nr:hypothetical protein AMSG_02670 [Thecamonas trahens ATCC 50062]KNC46219.1 hypothetical protein AMSG_02670 [Thecamonas trahens ATCC 50062]|eukprot:XP_013760516.1 hypothetical protein AMSG_02670 [Thecamonas trahens ATCC 50062]
MADSTDDMQPNPNRLLHCGLLPSITAAAYAPHASLIALGSRDGAIKILGCQGVELALLRPPMPCHVADLVFVAAAAVGDDSGSSSVSSQLLLVAAIGSELVVWDVTSPQASPEAKAYPTPDGAPVSALACGLGSHFVFTGSVRGDVTVFNCAKQRFSLYSIALGVGAISVLAPSPVDDGVLCVGTDDGVAMVVELASKTPRMLAAPATAPEHGRVTAMAWRRDGKRVAVAYAGSTSSALADFGIKGSGKDVRVFPIDDARVVDLAWIVPDEMERDALMMLTPRPRGGEGGNGGVVRIIHGFSAAMPDGALFVTHGHIDSIDLAAGASKLLPIVGGEGGSEAGDGTTSAAGVWPASPTEMPTMVVVTGSTPTAALAVLCDVSGGSAVAGGNQYLELPLPRSLALAAGGVTATYCLENVPLELVSHLYRTSPRGTYTSPRDEWPLVGGALGQGLAGEASVGARLLVTGHSSGVVSVWDVTTPALCELSTLNVNMACPTMPMDARVVGLAAACSTDGTLCLAVLCGSGEIYLVGVCTSLSDDDEPARHVVARYTCDGELSEAEEVVDVVPADVGLLVRGVVCPDGTSDNRCSVVALDTKGEHLALGLLSGAVVVVAVATLSLEAVGVAASVAEARATAVAFVRAPGDAPLVLAAGGSSGEAIVLPVAGEAGAVVRLPREGKASGGVTGVHVVGDEARHLAVVCEHEIRMYAWNEASTLDLIFTRLAKPTTSLVFSAVVRDGEHGGAGLVAVSSSGAVYVLSLLTLHLVLRDSLEAIVERPVTRSVTETGLCAAGDGHLAVVLDSGELVHVGLFGERRGLLGLPASGPYVQAAALPARPKRKGFFKSLLGGKSESGVSPELEELLGPVASDAATDEAAGDDESRAASRPATSAEVKRMMAENRNKLAERGEKMEQLGEQTAEMAENARQMEASIAEYVREQENKKWWQL